MNHSIYSLKQAWAGLSSKKGFFVTVVTTLGITLGALLCILTLADVAIVKPLPYPDQQRLYKLNPNDFNDKGELMGGSYDYPSLVNLFDKQTVFSQSALVHYADGVLSSQPTQPKLAIAFVTPDWFTMLGSKMAMGRAFEQTEEKDSYNPTAILSYETWQNEFRGDNTILEQSVSIDGVNYRVVGVLAKSFIEPQLFAMGVTSDVFLPWDYNPTPANARQSWGMIDNRRIFVGKLDSSLSVSQIEQTLSVILSDTWQEKVSHISFFNGWTKKITMQPLKEAVLGDSKNTVLLLLAGVIGLVIVACANISNLFMSRTVEQQRQLAIQAALGATKSQMFKALFAQSGLVVGISVLVALVIANIGFWGLQHYMALLLPRVDELAINSATLGSALLISLLLGLFFACLGTNMINYRVLNTTLQSSGKGTGIQVSQKARRLLVISQVTIVMILVFVNMGLLKDSLKVINQPLGFETKDIYNLTLSINSADNLSEEEKKSLMVEVKNKLSALPQVEDVSQAMTPFPPFVDARRIAHVIEATQERLVVSARPVDGRYFEAVKQPLIEGDFFSDADLKDENKLLIINDVYAAKLAGQGSAIGAKIRVGRELYTVSGVVKGVQMPTATSIPLRAYELTSESLPEFLVKLKPQQTLTRELAVTTLQEVSSQLDLLELEALDVKRDQILFTQYTTAVTSAVLAVLTFLLATIGLYGIINYATQMRRFEFGTRLAVGAKRMDMINLVIKDNAGAVGIGIVISVILMLALYIGYSEALANYINPQLFTLFSGTLVIISIMTLFACYWPLRSIINTQPIHSLRGNE